MVLPDPLGEVFVGDNLPGALNEERSAINDLIGEVDVKITLPGGLATGQLLRWDGVNVVPTDTRLFEGDGVPEGVVSAPVGSSYKDKSATDGVVEWTKVTGTGNTGWIISGSQLTNRDTGLRNVKGLASSPLPEDAVINTAYVRRVGQVVSMYLDLTMPKDAKDDWLVLPGIPGFSPGYDRYGALQDNRENANTGGTMVGQGGAVHILKTVAGSKRDRYSGMWITSSAWPSPLPGNAATP